MSVDALRAELKALLASWEYAYAMGHGCSLATIRPTGTSAVASRTSAR